MFLAVRGIFYFLNYFSLISGPPDGELGYIMNKFVELNQKNGPFSAFFVMGGVPTEESDLSSLFNLIKSDFTSMFSIYIA